jgi:hypothetical protein
MTEFWDKPAEKSGKVLAAFLEGLPLGETHSLVGRGWEEPVQMKGQTLWYSIYESLLSGLKLPKMG